MNREHSNSTRKTFFCFKLGLEGVNGYGFLEGDGKLAYSLEAQLSTLSVL